LNLSTNLSRLKLVRIEFNPDICPGITGRKWTEWDEVATEQEPTALNGQKFSPFTRQGSQVQSLSRPPFFKLTMFVCGRDETFMTRAHGARRAHHFFKLTMFVCGRDETFMTRAHGARRAHHFFKLTMFVCGRDETFMTHYAGAGSPVIQGRRYGTARL
jgi:hypothetical protein